MTLTLEDIGRLAGVSRSTVSRVINGQSNVRPDVKARVEEVIARTGYTPNAAARSLVSGRSGVVGLVIPSRVHALFEDPYFSLLIQGVSAAANRAGNTLTLFLFQDEEEERALYPRVVTSGFVDGLIVTATRMADPLLARMANHQLPIVVVGRPDTEGISYVDVDNKQGAMKVASHLCDLGYERIGLLGAPANTSAGIDRLTGFVEGLAKCGKALPPELRADGDFSEQSGYEAILKILANNPDAVFVASDTMAMGALRALRERGVRVPGDVALVGFDGSPAAARSVPPLTTVDQPIAETGKKAVGILNSLIAGDEVAPVVETLPVELIIRESSGVSVTTEDVNGI